MVPAKSSSVAGATTPARIVVAPVGDAQPEPVGMMSPLALFLILGGLLIGLTLVAISLGSTWIAPDLVWRVLANHLLPGTLVSNDGISFSDEIVVWLVRTPRVMVAALVGIALAIAGVQMQGMFQNPLASPDIVGTSSGSALGAVIAIATGLATRSVFYVPVFAFIGALAAVFLVFGIATRHGRTPVATLLLAGVALTALIGALTSFVISLKWVDYQVAQEILFWLMGGLDSRTWTHVWLIFPCVVIGAAMALIFFQEMDLLLLGEETARSLGVEVEHVKRMVLTSAALLTGAAVAVSGVIGFVGLVIPHIVRLVIGPKHRWLLPTSALAGAVFVIGADLIARTVNRPEEVRLGIITAVFGAPFFLYLLLRHNREAS
ncbi:MAG TPA: iron ABC transporter permease [Acidobacteriota bacterium]|nr:iron ABC transporter permease [Acidobacteriota bacterium]